MARHSAQPIRSRARDARVRAWLLTVARVLCYLAQGAFYVVKLLLTLGNGRWPDLM